MEKTRNEVMVRVDSKLLEQYRERHPELKGLTYTAVVEVMLRKTIGENKNERG